MGLRTRLLVGALALVGSACGGGDDPAAGGHAHGDHADSDHAHGEAAHEMFGAPADPADADRSIKVVATDPFRFEPDSLEVSQGETVVFEVTNDGGTLHEFVIGSEAGHEHGKDGDTAIQVEPGETKELAWTFTTTGNVTFACYVAGHYDAGMKGTISVTP